MNYLNSIILGAIEGVTEFLPISSTGHLILAGRILGIMQGDFLKSFEIAIQFGAILAVIMLYWRRFLIQRAVLLRVTVAFMPTALAGLILYGTVKALLGNIVVVLWALALGGVFLLFFDNWVPEKQTDVSEISRLKFSSVLGIGALQAVSMIPGISRAAATIVGGRLAGLTRTAAVEFSFLLAVPTMAAATGLDLFRNASVFSRTDFAMLTVGMLVSFLTAICAIKFLLSFVRTHDFRAFGIYRIILSVLFWLMASK